MRKSDLDFWQGMAAHYSKFMRRSAPIYAEICILYVFPRCDRYVKSAAGYIYKMGDNAGVYYTVLWRR